MQPMRNFDVRVQGGVPFAQGLGWKFRYSEVTSWWIQSWSGWV